MTENLNLFWTVIPATTRIVLSTLLELVEVRERRVDAHVVGIPHEASAQESGQRSRGSRSSTFASRIWLPSRGAIPRSARTIVLLETVDRRARSR